MSSLRVAVVGAGWAGLAAAVRAVEAGHRVRVFEMAGAAGGRARSAVALADGTWLDNGQHILIGAYTRTLALMRSVGADPDALLLRRPLALRFADGDGIELPGGSSVPSFLRGTISARGLSAADKLALLCAATSWALRRFDCDEHWTVQRLCGSLPPRVRQLLIDPLCVAALNTPAAQASARVFLRVLRDALFAAPGSSDLLLPRAPLSRLLPDPAIAWLRERGATVEAGRRVQAVEADGDVWRIGSEGFDRVVLACGPAECARLAEPVAPAWATLARALPYEPIITVVLQAEGAQLPLPMLALAEGAGAPAQFVFDAGALGGAAGRHAFVVSGARLWVDAGLEATTAAVQKQARAALARFGWPADAQPVHTLAEKRATFRCVPALQRPPLTIAAGLLAAGDHVLGPYPSTLEGAVRCGEAAAAAL